MRRHGFLPASLVARVTLGLLVAVTGAAAQGPTGAKAAAGAGIKKAWNAPRTVDGDPDLQGVWDFSTITPLERPAAMAGREFLTDQEIADLQRQATTDSTDDLRYEGVGREGFKTRQAGPAYNAFWWARGTTVVGTKRTSLIVDPPDGKIPPLTAAAQAREAARGKMRQHPAGPEDFDLNDRCIVGFNAGPPMIPDAYNNIVQIFQSRGQVAILTEMVHNARIVPLDGRPHLAGAIQQWVGDSRGHWEGNTLVVDTTNFTNEGLGLMFSGFRGSADENLHLTERFTRLDADLLLYEFTLDDLTTYTRPWSGALTMARSPNKVYEYACHEGNHSLPNTLSGERAEQLRSQGGN